MDTLRKLRSGKYITQNENVKSSKRCGDLLEDTTNKKRILGDITNKNAINNTFIGKKVQQCLKSTWSTLSLDENLLKTKEVSEVKISLTTSDDSSAYITASEGRSRYSTLNGSDGEDIYENAVSELQCKKESSPTIAPKEKAAIIVKVSPKTPAPEVEDFDSTCEGDVVSVSPYVKDIFIYYRQREKQFPVSKYMDTQKELSRSMRSILVDWMVEVQESFELNHETLYLAVKLTDLFLSKRFVQKARLQLLGAVAVFVSAKFDERCPPAVEDFLYICDDSYNRHEFLKMEILLLKAVDFDLGIPVSYRFLRRYARCARIPMDLLTLARYILETSLMDYELIDQVDSKMAAAALLLALRMKGKDWTPTLKYYSQYDAEDLEPLLYPLNKGISGPVTKHLQTIRTKYSHQIFYEVAKIPPLKLDNKK